MTDETKEVIAMIEVEIQAIADSIESQMQHMIIFTLKDRNIEDSSLITAMKNRKTGLEMALDIIASNKK